MMSNFQARAPRAKQHATQDPESTFTKKSAKVSPNDQKLSHEHVSTVEPSTQE